MLDDFIATYQTATVVVAQTTYAVVATPAGNFRIDFIDKAEARLKPKKHGALFCDSVHPLLLGYNGGAATVYINSRPKDSQSFFTDIQEQIQTIYQGWRDWRCVLFGRGEHAEHWLRTNLSDGSGMLLQKAPALVVKTVVDICTTHGVSTTVFGDAAPVPHTADPFYVLLIGSSYVIVKGFRVHAL